MSLMETLFGSPMKEILKQIPVADEVAAALLGREGFFGELLNLAEHTERIEEASALLLPALAKLDLSADELYRLQVEAFEWSNNVSSNAN